MNKSVKMMLPTLFILSALAATGAASALPSMDITSAKGTLTSRQKTPMALNFIQRRVRDQPSFDKIGIGNYYAEYKLNAVQKLQVWMYVETTPPMVDRVVLYIYPAKPSDLAYKRALDLINIVYGESTTGSKVVGDFRDAYTLDNKNKYKLSTQTFQQRSLLPQAYDGALYYLGKSFGYKVLYHLNGVEVDILNRAPMEKFIMGVKDLRYPDPKPTPKPGPTPTPVPQPTPAIVW